MHIERTMKTTTQAVLIIKADPEELSKLKQHVLKHFRNKVKLAGFREGKAPLELVEKNADPAALQSEFLEEAVERFYAEAISQERLRPVLRPEIELKKFVPFTTLEFEAHVPVVGDIKMPDYTKVKKNLEKVSVTDADVEEVIQSLRKRLSEKKLVERAAESGDEAWIDFTGVNDKGEPVKGAEGKDYPLILGSDTFIPGFEANVIGMKAGQEKTFTLIFPKDYGVKALSGNKVTFTVTATKVEELTQPKVDDEFAKKAGPFASLKQLKEDIRLQVGQERQQQAQASYEADIIKEITAKTKVDLPEQLIDEQSQSYVRDFKQNVAYRGLTWAEFLEREGKSEEQYLKEDIRPQAIERLKASIVLAEISEKENIQITPEELDTRMQLLRAQYKDAAMQAELEKPEARRDIASRILTEKTIARLVEYATK